MTNPDDQCVYQLRPSLFVPTSNEPASRYVLDGQAMATDQQLFSEFSRRLSFPHYFGHNWDAFEETLTTPDEWEKPSDLRIVLRITNAQHILSESSRIDTFVDILMGASTRLRSEEPEGLLEFQFVFPTTFVAQSSDLWDAVGDRGGSLLVSPNW